jgi:hypothetical protein
VRAWYAPTRDGEALIELEVARFPAPPGERSVSIVRMASKWTTSYASGPTRTVQFHIDLNRRNTARFTTSVVSAQLAEHGTELAFHGFYSLERKNLLSRISGEAHWFLTQMVPDLDPYQCRDPENRAVLEQILSVPPVPGQWFVPDQEFEVCQLLAMQPPPAWDGELLEEKLGQDPTVQRIRSAGF